MKSIVLAILSLLIFVGSIVAADATRPNIVFILADDWGWGDLGCHGNSLVKTPNIDRLAREGTDFHQFNVANPVCSPSRTAFTTGRFPARFCVHEAIGALAKNREVNQVDWLDPHVITLPKLLQAADYATGHVGKWHLCSGQAADAPMPAAYGIADHALFDGTSPPSAKTVEHHAVFAAAADFIRRHKGEPFYLNLWMHETHLAHYPTAESLQENAHLGKPQGIYSSAIADGDKGIGQVLDTLRELKLEQNTLVVFSSDNGPENTNRQEELRGGYGGMYSVGSTGDLRGRKRSLYEGGVRLPFIVRWPGHVPAGRVDKHTNIASVDFLPTICAATGVKPSADFSGDGEDMLPALLGREQQRTTPLFWQWVGSARPADCWPRFAVRRGDWKLLSDGGSRVELYRLPDDWSEARDLANQEKPIVEQLQTLLNEWRASLPKQPPAEFISKKQAARRAAADNE